MIVISRADLINNAHLVCGQPCRSSGVMQSPQMNASSPLASVQAQRLNSGSSSGGKGPLQRAQWIESSSSSSLIKVTVACVLISAAGTHHSR